MVRTSRRQRRLVDGRLTDWIVVRNRLSSLGSRNKKLVGDGLVELSKRLGFRCIDGFAERVVYREFFPRSLTAFDDLNEATLGDSPEPVAFDGARGGDCAAQCNAPAAVGKRKGGPPPARSGIRSWTSRCRCTTSSDKQPLWRLAKPPISLKSV